MYTKERIPIDKESQIHHLMLIIKGICEENKLSKSIILQDFVDILLKDYLFEEMSNRMEG